MPVLHGYSSDADNINIRKVDIKGIVSTCYVRHYSDREVMSRNGFAFIITNQRFIHGVFLGRNNGIFKKKLVAAIVAVICFTAVTGGYIFNAIAI